MLVWHLEEHPAYKQLSDEVLAQLSVCSEVQMICHMVQPISLPPHHLLLHENPDSFNVSGATLPMLSWKRDRWTGICHYQLYLVLASEKWRKQSTAPSIRSLAGIYRKDEARPLVGVSALNFLQCFDTVGRITRRTIKTTCAINPWRFFSGTSGDKNKVRKQTDPGLPTKQPLNRGCCCHYQLLITRISCHW